MDWKTTTFFNYRHRFFKELQKSTVSPKKLARNSVLEEDGLIRNNIATENKYTMKYDTIPQDVIGKLWIGKDYVNTSRKTETDLDQPFCGRLEYFLCPHLPVHISLSPSVPQLLFSVLNVASKMKSKINV